MITLPSIVPADRACGEEAQRILDRKTKPTGSLGELEHLVVRIAAARSKANPEPLRAAIVLAAADHGYADENVSAYPAEVTGQMLANISAGGAAVSEGVRVAASIPDPITQACTRPSAVTVSGRRASTRPAARAGPR